MQVNLSYGNMKFIFQLLEETPNIYSFSCLQIFFILFFFFFGQFFVKQKFGMSWNYFNILISVPDVTHIGIGAQALILYPVLAVHQQRAI